MFKCKTQIILCVFDIFEKKLLSVIREKHILCKTIYKNI